jgi:hypothetical protein
MGLYPVVILGMLGDTPDAGLLKRVHALSGDGLTWVLGVDPAKIVLDDKGIRAK